MMKKSPLSLFVLLFALASCQPSEDKTVQAAEKKDSHALVTAPCAFTETDSAATQQRLQGEWELAGIQTNYMGLEPDKFLTGADIGVPKTLAFYPNHEFETTVNGHKEGNLQKYKVEAQSLSPLAYQFWFCGESMLILSNVAADGATEVYIKK